MGIGDKRWHELFRTETVLREIKDISPDLVTGSYPEAFAKELITKWGFGDAVSLGSLGFVARVCRDDVPEELELGFGQYYGVGMTPISAALFHSQHQLQEYFEKRLLDARNRKGDFSDTSIAS